MYVKCVNNWNHVNELFSEVPIKKADGPQWLGFCALLISATVGCVLLIK